MISTFDRPGEPRRRSLLHRRDIDGLRGLAIALVVVFHVFVGRVSSGVDVFLLVGGVFFFGPQIRNALNPAGLTVVQAFLRIFRRLYPALVVVVGVTLAVAVAVFARVRWEHTAGDAVASLLYHQNLHLASEGEDYSAIGSDVSLYQHIWSMSAQMQVYAGSLLVITLVVGVVSTLRRKRAGGSPARGLLIVATAASFIYAAYLHATDQGLNYYSPLTRFWEIGLGGIFGLYLLNRPFPRKVRVPAGVVGVVLIIGTGLFLDGAAQFPGPLTLIPLAGAALVILAGNADSADRADRAERAGTTAPVGVPALLVTRPFQFLGRISYSLYLWHWPLLVLATYLCSPDSTTEVASGGLHGITASLGGTRGTLVGLGVIALSLLLAQLTYRFVERPLQQQRKPQRSWVLFRRGYLAGPLRTGKGRAKAVAAVLLAVVTGGVMGFSPWVRAANESRTKALTVADVDQSLYPGPAALLDDAPVPQVGEVLPDPINADPMMADTLKDGCVALFDTTDLVFTKMTNTTDEPCEYGDTESSRTMYLAGGSHSEHFLPALDLIARERHVKIVPVIKLGCVLGMGDLPKWDGSEYPECAEWDRKAQQYILDNPPTDGVFMTVTRPTTIQGDGPDQVPAEYVDMVRKLSDAGIHTWGMRDTPWVMSSPGVQGNVRVCVAEGRYTAGDATKDCGIDREEAVSAVNPAVSAYRGLDITELDVTNALCTDTRCPGVVGNVLVYRDAQHLTNLFAAMLAPEIYRQMYDGGSISGSASATRGPSATGGGDTTDGPAPKDVRRVPKPLEPGYTEADPSLLEEDSGAGRSTAPSRPASQSTTRPPAAPEPAPAPAPEPAPVPDTGGTGGVVDNDYDGYDDYTGAVIPGGVADPAYYGNYYGNPYGYGYGY